jgi:hypothetical protein
VAGRELRKFMRGKSGGLRSSDAMDEFRKARRIAPGEPDN